MVYSVRPSLSRPFEINLMSIHNKMPYPMSLQKSSMNDNVIENLQRIISFVKTECVSLVSVLVSSI